MLVSNLEVPVLTTIAIAVTLLSCAGAGPSKTPGPDSSGEEPVALGDALVLGGGVVVGQGLADVLIVDGRIESVGGEMPEDAQLIDVTGKWIVPAFIDSHVHIAYWEVGSQLPAGGLAGVVDLAAPEEWLGRSIPGLEVRWSGPMVTATRGYPTQSWGANGYGVECEDAEAAGAAVDRLVDAGAQLIKLPVTGSPSLGEPELSAAASRAEARGVLSVSHALSDSEARLAREAGVDVLAHTPTGALSSEAVAAWSEGAVISTLEAFGGRSSTVENLRQLRAAGATVLYGTDLGNARTAGISSREIALMQEAGMDGAAILAAGTEAPADLWGFSELGRVAPGKRASVLILDRDPLQDPSALAEPVDIFMDGQRP